MQSTSLTAADSRLNDLVYVCVISTFNLPDYESCMLRRPAYLVLVVSDGAEFRESAERFSNVIQQELEGIHIIRPDARRGFKGTDLAENQRWCTEILKPALDELPAHLPRVCNITGGTKSMTLMLANTSFGWQFMDYKAETQPVLQKIHFNNGQLECLGAEHLRSALPLVVARLYSSKVRQEYKSAVMQHPDSAAASQALWHGLKNGDLALLKLFGNETSGLERVWKYGLHNPDFDRERLCMSSREFIHQDSFSTEQINWLQSWQQLDPAALDILPDPAGGHALCLPGNRLKKRQAGLRRWLSGEWLEQLAESWLKEAGIPAEQIAVNVKVSPGNENNSSTGERESDVLVHYKGTTSVIEVKTDFPPNNENFNDLLRQLASFKERLGRVRQILLIGPQLHQKICNKYDDILLRCKADNILLAHDAQSLCRAVLEGKHADSPNRHLAV